MPKISELDPAALPLVGDEAVPIVQGGETVQAPAAALGGLQIIERVRSQSGFLSFASFDVEANEMYVIEAFAKYSSDIVTMPGPSGDMPLVSGGVGAPVAGLRFAHIRVVWSTTDDNFYMSFTVSAGPPSSGISPGQAGGGGGDTTASGPITFPFTNAFIIDWGGFIVEESFGYLARVVQP